MQHQPQNDIEDSNEVERLYRRNSLFAASVISIYSIAGGKLGQKLSAGLFDVSFSKPHVLEYSLIVVAGYFCWRHWLVSKELRKKLVQNALNSTGEFKWIKIFLSNKVNSLIGQGGWGSADAAGAHFDPFRRRLTNVGFVNIEYSFSYTDEFGDRVDKVVMVNLCKHPLVFLALSIRYRFAWFKNAISDTHFGDGVMPLFMMIVALLLYGFNLTLR